MRIASWAVTFIYFAKQLMVLFYQMWYEISKKFTSKKIIQTIIDEPESRREWLLPYFQKACEHLKREQQYKVWQDGYHAEHIYSNSFINQKLEYIHNNPVVAGIVDKAEEYVYSSARDYFNGKQCGLLEVELL